MTNSGIDWRELSRRSYISESITLVAGGVIGMFLAPFRLWIIYVLPDVLVRRAKVGVGYGGPIPTNPTIDKPKRESVIIENYGGEAAEDVAIRIGFSNEIVDYFIARTNST
jgi:hypothetical protein